MGFIFKGDKVAHYFTNDYIESKEIKTKCIINNRQFIFITDNGVFSKKGLDFGTRTLLSNLDNLSGDVLDFGCGYGPIGIYIAKTFDTKVDMVDINKRAIVLSKKNAKENNVDVNIFESDIYSKIEKKYDYIVTNPPIRVGKKILYEILFQAKQHLTENGKLLFVIHKDQGAKTLIKNLQQEYNIEIIGKNKGFYVVSAQSK